MRQRRYIGIAGQAIDRVVTRVDRVDVADEAVLPEVSHRAA
jgi:hypothetical protein